MSAILVMEGRDKGLFLPLGKRSAIIGRDPGAQLQLNDATASRKHLQVRLCSDTDRYMVTDLRSGNGTFVNNNRIDGEVALRHGDEIRVGQSVLMFSDEVPTDRANALEILKSVGERDRATMMRQD